MPLEVNELETMLVELTLGKPPSLNTPEANAMRERMKVEVDEIIARGDGIEIPHEIPDVTPLG